MSVSKASFQRHEHNSQILHFLHIHFVNDSFHFTFSIRTTNTNGIKFFGIFLIEFMDLAR